MKGNSAATGTRGRWARAEECDDVGLQRDAVSTQTMIKLKGRRVLTEEWRRWNDLQVLDPECRVWEWRANDGVVYWFLTGGWKRFETKGQLTGAANSIHSLV